MSKVKLNLIAAACENMGIGVNGTLPWRLKGEKRYRHFTDIGSYTILLTDALPFQRLHRKEMNYFTTMTSKVIDSSKKNAVIMGRVTWDCIPDKYRPLPNRINIVLTRHVEKIREIVPNGVVVVSNLDEAISHIENREDIESAWVIGGSSIYKMAMEHPNWNKIYLTEIQKSFICDTFFPAIDKHTYIPVTEDGVPQDLQTEGDISYYYKIYKRN